MAAESEITALWAAAVKEYTYETGRSAEDLELRELPGSSSGSGNGGSLGGIESADDLVARLEAGGSAFRGWRNRHGRLFGLLRNFVQPVIQLLKIAITPVSTLDFGAPGSAVLGALLYLVKACEGVSDAYDWVEQVFRELQEFAERLEVYAAARIDEGLKKKIVAILSFVLRITARSEKLIRDRRFREYLRVTFLGKDEKTRKLLDDLNALFGSEQRFVLAVTFASAQRTEDKANAILDKTSENAENIKALLRLQGNDRGKALDLLRPVLYATSANSDVEETFVRNQRALIEGTGTWLQGEPLFKSWIEGIAPILWVFGGPGAGKSFLSTWIVNSLFLEDPQVRGPVAYFFIKENSEVLRDANVILKTLAAQILERDPDFRQHAVAVCSERARTITAEDTWENLFLGYYGNGQRFRLGGSGPRATIVVDGLDEASPATRRAVLTFAQDVIGSKRAALQIAIVGRSSLRGDMNFVRLEKVYFIEVSKTKNRDDIDSYIRKRLEEVEVLRVMKKLKPNGLKRANRTGAVIRNRVLDGADGVFLWAKLLLDSIISKDVPQIEAILANPPQTLDDMIWSVFDRLARDDEIDHVNLVKMLLVMTYSRRPLVFGEIDLILSLPKRKPNLLLWQHTRGKLSSVFDLKYPPGFDPDAEDDSSQSQSSASSHGDDGEASDAESGSGSDDGAFDFTGENGDDDDDNFDDSELFSPVLDRGIGSFHGLGSNEDGTSTLHHLEDGQLKTQLAFYHTRIRDYIEREGIPERRKKPALAIIPDNATAHADMTIICLQMFKTEAFRGDGQRYLGNYPLAHMPHHLEAVPKAATPLAKRIEIIEGLYWLFGTERGAAALIQSVGEIDEFHDSNDMLWPLWVGTDRYFRLVQTWFGSLDEEIIKSTSWDESMVTWMEGAAKGFDLLLRPLMMAASKIWFLRKGWEDGEVVDKGEWPCWLLHSWLTLVETGKLTPLLEDFRWSYMSGQLQLLESPDRLVTLANWSGLEKDTHWYANLGTMMVRGRFYEQAEEYLKQSIELHQGAWVSMESLAQCNAEQGNLIDAIEWMQKAAAALPESMEYIGSFLWPQIATWKEVLEDEDGAYEAARIGYEAMTYSVAAQHHYVRALAKRNEHEKIMEVLELLDCQTTSYGYSWLSRMFLYDKKMMEIVGKACREQGQPEYVLRAIVKAVEAGSTDNPGNRLWLPYWAGKFNLDYYDSRGEEGAALLELFLERLEQTKDNEREGFMQERREARRKLALTYFDSLVASRRQDDNETHGAPSVADAEAKLKRLAIAGTTTGLVDYDGFDYYRDDYPVLLWGRWLRDYAGAEEAAWRKCFRGRLLEEMKAMDDEDPGNDTPGLQNLAVTLCHAGDRENYSGIMAMLFSRVAEGMAEEDKGKEKEGEDGWEEVDANDGVHSEEERGEEAQSEHEEDTEGQAQNESGSGSASASASVDEEGGEEGSGEGSSDSESESESSPIETPANINPDNLWLHIARDAGVYVCDECERETSEVECLWFCEICDGATCWCERCLPLLKGEGEGRLSKNQCSGSHVFYRAWPVPEEGKVVAAERLGMGVTVTKRWLEELRTEWWK